jgi:hypothetical protein
MDKDYSIRERVEAFWRGERPSHIPYTMYWCEYLKIEKEPETKNILEHGLGITCHPPVIGERNTSVKVEFVDYQDNGNSCRRQTLKTPVGEIFQEWRNGWHHRYFLHTAEDYRTMTWIVKHAELFSTYDAFRYLIEHGEYWQVPIIGMGRTPYQEMLVDYAGLQNFCFHTIDFTDEVECLYQALMQKFARKVEIIAASPGLYVSNLENFTAESFSPDVYQRYLVNVYEKFWPELHRAGKIIGTHYDGRTRACAELIAKAPLDMIESLTEPNEGDMLYEECRKFWPNKLFWGNIRVGNYNLPEKELKKKVTALYSCGKKSDGSGIAFEVSEELPLNWRESIPKVLEILKELT